MQRNGLLNYANEVVNRVVSDAARYAPEERLSALAARLSDELSFCDALTRELVISRVARYIHLHPEQLRRFVESSTSNARSATATLVAATEIASQAENVQWIQLLGVDGYIGRELVTLLSAEPKTGKTTLLLYAVRDWVWCGHRVVWFSEESRSAWKQRLERHAELRSERLLLAFENSATARVSRLRPRYAKHDRTSLSWTPSALFATSPMKMTQQPYRVDFNRSSLLPATFAVRLFWYTMPAEPTDSTPGAMLLPVLRTS